MKLSDYVVTDGEIEANGCPNCWANAGESCQTPTGDYADHHAARIRKAQSIARDYALAGCLPEHDPIAFAAAMAAHKARHATAPAS